MDRFERLEGLVRRASRVAGRLDAVERQLETFDGAVADETSETVRELCEGIRTDVAAMVEMASSFLDREADSRALYSMTSVFTSDLSEVAAHLPEGGDLGHDVEPFAATFEEVCEFFERELELLGAALALEVGVEESAINEGGDVASTSEAVLERLAELQAERQSVAEQLADEGEIAEFELTETAFFD